MVLDGDRWSKMVKLAFLIFDRTLAFMKVEFYLVFRSFSTAAALVTEDFFSLPWEEFVLEHNRHHASTVDLLIQGEFGWDPEEFHYALQQWAGPFSTNWSTSIAKVTILTCPFDFLSNNSYRP